MSSSFRILSIFILLISSSSYAFKLSPMVINFGTSGSKVTQVLVLENPTNEKVPVQIEVFSRAADAQGEELRTKTNDFNIYPEQVVLLPQEKRNVRITWSGHLKDANEMAYRIVASQLPVEFKEHNEHSKKPGVSLNFLLQYVASAYVTPDNASAKVKIKDVRVVAPKKIELTLQNAGNAHKVLYPQKITLKAGNTVVMELIHPKELDGVNLLAQSEKKIILPLPKEIQDKKSLSGEIELADKD